MARVAKGGTAAMLALLLASGCSRQPEPAPNDPPQAPTVQRADPYGPDFMQQWGGGLAEVAVYDLTMPAAGGLQKGTATTYTTLETYSNSARVKADPSHRGGADLFQAMEFNTLKRYGAGPLEQINMLSVAITLADVNGLPAGAATKASYSTQTPAGHSWSQLLFHRDRATGVRYGIDRAVQRNISYSNVRLTEDALPLVARRIAWPRLRLGQTYPIELLGSVETEALRGTELQVENAVLSIPPDRQTVETPAGAFRCHRFTAKWEDGRTKVWLVEADPPFRVVRWIFSDGEQAGLVSFDRK